MSTMMLPEEAPGLPVPPGGGAPMMGGPAPPMDQMSGGPLPGEGGLDGLMAALAGGAGGGPPGAAGLPEGVAEADDEEDMSPIEHIREAVRHLVAAMGKEDDDERGATISKGMSTLQGVLGGEQKQNAQLGAMGG